MVKVVRGTFVYFRAFIDHVSRNATGTYQLPGLFENGCHSDHFSFYI